MKQDLKILTYKEQVFLISISFFTLMSLLSAFFSKENSSWIIVTSISLIATLLSFIKFHGTFIRKAGLYLVIFPFLPLCWYNNFFDLVPNTIYTILIFVLINTLTANKEKIILNIIATIIIETVFIAIYVKHPKININELKNYILKWIISLPLLTSSMILIIRTIQKSRALEKQQQLEREQSLMEQSITDHLTGLYNRSYMEKKLKSTHNIWRRGIKSYSLVMIDIDYFKKYNDYYGHIKGDECLKTISRILKEQMGRDTDYAFRYGGEEFLLILSFTDRNGAELIARNIKSAVAAAKIPHPGSEVDDFVTLSMGIGTICKESESLEELLNMTDKALYNAKCSGRNRIAFT